MVNYLRFIIFNEVNTNLHLYLLINSNIMEEKPSLLKSAMNYGAMLGIVLIAVSLIFYLLDITDSTISTITTSVVTLGGIYYIQIHYRMNVLGGYMSYGEALGVGTVSMIFASVISAFYLYIFLTFIDASQIDIAMEQAYNDMVERGMEEEQINQAMEFSTMLMTPGMMAVMGFLGSAFFGFIFSLITSIFTKKQDPSIIE